MQGWLLQGGAFGVIKLVRKEYMGSIGSNRPTIGYTAHMP
jgi:hypothetical protein